ncbi:MAG: proton-conducting membrane transporter [Lachnospiraceae bacterium]|nr:proton-conducting membrane transporter [Lachnospiraceae bacterium]
MTKYLPLITILLPIFGSILIPLVRFKSRRVMCIYTEALVIVNSILVFLTILFDRQIVCEVIHFTGDLSISFVMDGLSVVFAGLVAFLWPLATLYSFEYMKKEEHENIFFLFFVMTYGVTLGIAMAEDYITMYCFYEFLTIVTVPLVMHTLTREAILASRKYLYYSLGGAAFAFISLIFIIKYGTTNKFIFGGTLDPALIGDRTNVLLLIYVFAFFGFGVKAALCPFNSWLPSASVAPTPVTALLHAVAVVKAGAFAILRMTYYSFGADFLRGTWAQYVVMTATIITIVYGCSRALKETHFKRRLAYSTISNLSYILFGCALMTPLGMTGAITHLVFHALMKITSFFCAGAVMHQTDRHYVYELDGLGRKMPATFTIFTVSSLALMGVPGFAGFISKWNLAAAAVDSGNGLAYTGVAALLVSALLTAIYMLSVVMRAFFPGKDFDPKQVANCKDPNWIMLVPLAIFAIVVLLFGVCSAPLTDYFAGVAAGTF